MKAIAFFSGVGGIELGFKQAGIDTIWANDFDPNASKTYSMNHQNKIITKDINNIKLDEIPYADFLLAGFPCQAFSIAGYRKGFEDKRGNVFFKLAKIINHIKPKVIFLENVKNIISHDKGNTYRVIHETLENYGYHIKLQVLNAANFGNIPQNRERAYIIGFLDKTIYQRFENINPIKLNKKISDFVLSDKLINDKYYYSNKNFKHYNMLCKNVTKKDTIYQFRRVYFRENKSGLCPSLTANMGLGGHNVPIIITEKGIRKLSPLECFMFQGFPKEFKLPNIADTHLYKQAGNSVVVPVIKRLAEKIIMAMKQ